MKIFGTEKPSYAAFQTIFLKLKMQTTNCRFCIITADQFCPLGKNQVNSGLKSIQNLLSSANVVLSEIKKKI